MTPREILEEQLYKYQKSLQKSAAALSAGSITTELHHIHQTNLEPKIAMFQEAVNVLKANNII